MQSVPLDLLKQKFNLQQTYLRQLTVYEVPSFLRTLEQPHYRMVHPDFGELNAEQALTLNRKHVRHHLAQFGLMER